MVIAFKDYTAEIEAMSDLPDCRIRIPGENMWGKQLPDGKVIINNEPLDQKYRWRDVVDPRTNPPEVLFRYYMAKVWVRYRPVDGLEKQKLAHRKKIWEALNPLGNAGFFFEGVAYVQFREEFGVEKKVRDALAPIQVEILQLEVEGNMLPEGHPQKVKA